LSLPEVLSGWSVAFLFWAKLADNFAARVWAATAALGAVPGLGYASVSIG